MHKLPKLAATVLVLAALAFAGPLDDIDRLMDHGHWKRAQAALQKEVAARPNDPDVLRLQARLKHAQGDTDAAKKLADRAVELRPNDPKLLMTKVEIDGDIAGKGSFFTKIRMAGGIKSNMERAAQLDPKYIPAQVGLLQYYLQAPGIAGGSVSKAKDVAARLEALDPVEGAFARVAIARHEKNTAAIEGLYKKAVTADPRSYGAQMALANLYASDQHKKYDLAEKHGRAALAIDPSRIAAYNLLAGLYARAARWPELDALLVKAESGVPNNLSPHYQAGRILIVEGKDPARAERYFRKYLTVAPELGAPTHAHAWWRIAHALEKQGKKPEAVEALRTALRLKPDLEDAKKDLKRLS